MFWILQRTRLSNAAALLNSLNANGNGNSIENRPLRKEYHKLDSDEKTSTTYQEDDIAEHETSCKNNNVENSSVSDTDCSFTDNELDNKENDFTDESDYDEALTCNVCDRMFACPKQLSSHKQKKRHFGCSACDSIFPSIMTLEHHKEEFEHWSDEEGDFLTDSEDDDSVSEECERLI